jgi:hypothetical protein
MNAQDIINEIENIPCNDPALMPLGNALHQYTKQFQSGELSKDEYLELLQDLHTEQLINAQCSDLNAKERLNTICNAVINAASLLSSV